MIKKLRRRRRKNCVLGPAPELTPEQIEKNQEAFERYMAGLPEVTAHVEGWWDTAEKAPGDKK